MEKLKTKFSFNFWMILFLFITGGMVIYFFWPKIRELLMDLKFLYDFLKEKAGEKKAFDDEDYPDELN
ncbi:MAG: hypothetical protein PHV06_08265 [bacterium]|nr:hypothetical protein [bacterium]